jgi:ergothioneine biosynthesis protein EgtB
MQAGGSRVIPGTDLGKLYAEVRSFTEKLCEPLETEDYVPQPTVEVSPVKWNIAHTTWFFEEFVLKKYSPNYRVFNDAFGFLFNSYYNTVGERVARDRRGVLSRPTLEQVTAYRRYVDDSMMRLLSETASVSDPDSLAEIVELGINHEQQHQELLLTDLKYTFSLNPLQPVYRADAHLEAIRDTGTPAFVKYPADIYEIGSRGTGFCFDNELPRHKLYLGEFAISNVLVTNAEFVEFIEAGGYLDHRLWLSDGWDWVRQNEVVSPLYWYRDGDNWKYFTLSGPRSLPSEAPVCHISLFEASAFAHWKGMRLPTEAEWEVASDGFDWHTRWEWTASSYLPYPGFKAPDGAVGEYNGKFMINQMVLRGASVATPPGHSRSTYRNFFQPHLRWQFTGIRLCRD